MLSAQAIAFAGALAQAGARAVEARETHTADFQNLVQHARAADGRAFTRMRARGPFGWIWTRWRAVPAAAWPSGGRQLDPGRFRLPSDTTGAVLAIAGAISRQARAHEALRLTLGILAHANRYAMDPEVRAELVQAELAILNAGRLLTPRPRGGDAPAKQEWQSAMALVPVALRSMRSKRHAALLETTRAARHLASSRRYVMWPELRALVRSALLKLHDAVIALTPSPRGANALAGCEFRGPS